MIFLKHLCFFRNMGEDEGVLSTTLPFKRLPKAMIQAFVYHAAKGLNQFPAKNGISDTLSPLTIMTGRANPDYNDLKLEFGSYVQVFEDNTPATLPPPVTLERLC
jgi:hypothetical protein